MNNFADFLLFIERVFNGFSRRLRNRYYSCVLGSMGHGCQVSKRVLITGARNIYLGNKVIVNDSAILQSCEEAQIHIGNHVSISYGAYILTGGRDITEGIIQEKHKTAPVIIEDGAWIGAKAIILPGVTIGEGALIAAGSVVTHNIEARILVAGVPAIKIRNIS